jgi:UDP-N-acetylmuramoylalanine--D-glutamate ligase
MIQLDGARIVILGLARQGVALARYMAGQGAQVTASDVKPAEALSEALRALEGVPVRYALGGHPLSLLDKCDLLCLSGGVPIDLPIVVEAQRCGIPTSNDAQIFLERCPAMVLGITGSAGKTTTTALTGEMLKAGGLTTWVGGNIGNPLVADLDKIRAGDVVVMELSSFQLELMTSSPHVAAVLNITPNHLDRHPTMDAYIAAKKRILDFQQPGDVAILGYDDPEARKLIPSVAGKIGLFGKDGETLRNTQYVSAFVHDGRIILRLDDEIEVCAIRDLKLRGPHNVLNILAACLLAQAGGASVEAMAGVATSFAGVEHRLQLVGEFNGVRYYDDSIATAPERLVAALKSFDEPIVLLCGGRDKHLPWDEAAALIAQRVSHLILFGEMADLVEDAVQRASSTLHVHRAGTLDTAVKVAAQVARPGDVVLLSPGGTSFDAFKDFAERGVKFAEWVRQIQN